MKTFLILVIASLLYVSCKKDGGNNDPTNFSQVKIKGHFASTKGLTFDPSLATQVILFNINGEYSTSPITNGAFSVQINKDEPVGLTFSNNSKAFLGYLSLGQGIEFLPLNYLNDTVSTVDLGLLNATNNLVTSEYDLLQQKMKMSAEQIKSCGQAGVNFSAMVKNPDVDRNGIIDLLENKYYHISFLYFGDGGHFTTTPSKNANMTLVSFRITFSTKDQDTPASVTFSSLDGSLTLGTNQKKESPGFTEYYSEMLYQNSPQFSSCKIVYKSQTLYFDIPDQTGTLNNAVYVFPTFHYDTGNNLNKISWIYYSGNSSTTIDASKIILNVQAQVAGNDYNTRLYDSQNYGPETTQDVLSVPIALVSIGQIYMAYDDIFGNSVVIGYKHP